MTIEPVTFINALFAAFAVVFGLSSRNFSTSVVTGLFMGLVHAGLIWLVTAQSGATAVTELPYLKEAVDCAMNYKAGVDLVMGYLPLTVAQVRLIAYLVTIGFATLVTTIVAYLVRWVICSMISFAPPKSAAS